MKIFFALFFITVMGLSFFYSFASKNKEINKEEYLQVAKMVRDEDKLKPLVKKKLEDQIITLKEFYEIRDAYDRIEVENAKSEVNDSLKKSFF